MKQRKRLNHSKIDEMTPVDGWEQKVNILNSWVENNYSKIRGEGIPLDVFHAVYVSVYNRLKYTNWTLDMKRANGYLFSACWLEKREASYKDNKLVKLEYEVEDVDVLGDEPQCVQLSDSKLKECVKQLSNKQQKVYEQIFVYRRTINEISDELGYPYKVVHGAFRNALVRIGQLYHR